MIGVKIYTFQTINQKILFMPFSCKLFCVYDSDFADISSHSTQEKHKLSILNKQDAVGKMRAQVVQSPDRMKADISRMHNALASRKETKKEKGRRVQELRGQNENCQMLLQSSEQGVSMISGINTELEKQRWAVCDFKFIQYSWKETYYCIVIGKYF